MDRNEILKNWQTEQDREWFAVDMYNPVTGKVTRMYVGDAESAKRMAANFACARDLVDDEGNPAEPGVFGEAAFYRATIITPQEAYDYMVGLGHEEED